MLQAEMGIQAKMAYLAYEVKMVCQVIQARKGQVGHLVNLEHPAVQDLMDKMVVMEILVNVDKMVDLVRMVLMEDLEMMEDLACKDKTEETVSLVEMVNLAIEELLEILGTEVSQGNLDSLAYREMMGNRVYKVTEDKMEIQELQEHQDYVVYLVKTELPE